jgi:hypothetical protein
VPQAAPTAAVMGVVLAAATAHGLQGQSCGDSAAIRTMSWADQVAHICRQLLLVVVILSAVYVMTMFCGSFTGPSLWVLKVDSSSRYCYVIEHSVVIISARPIGCLRLAWTLRAGSCALD